VHLTTTLQQQVGESVDDPSAWFVRGFAFATVVVLFYELVIFKNALPAIQKFIGFFVVSGLECR